MGFFSDLKEDLSQAVNELMPEELMEEASRTELSAAGKSEETGVQEDALSLEEMLKNIDAMSFLEEDNVKEAVNDMADEKSSESPKEVVAEEIAFSDFTKSENMFAGMETVASETESVEAQMPVTQSLEEEEKADDMVQEALLYQEQVYRDGADKELENDKNGLEEIQKEDKGAEEMDSYANRQAIDETAVITAGMQIKGDITSEGSVEVVGTVEGNIDVLGKLNVTGHINGNSKASEFYAEGAKINGEIISAGSVKIGNSSVIIGNITAKSAAIAGAVKGDIDVQGPVILDASAIVMGNIKSKSVQINNGAVIEGMCSQCYADVSPLSFFDEYKSEIKNTKKNK